MIELSRSREPVAAVTIKVIGVGGAGGHAVDQIFREGIAGVELMVANTDARALSASLTSQKIGLGRALTRGLGAGGDPELGAAAARESASEITEKLAGASLVILVTGLGGGTSSGAAPVIAEIARDLGAHVAVVATLPFAFEGRRRREQAVDGVRALRAAADLVVCFENERMSSIAEASSGVLDAFATVDALLAQAVRALSALVRRRNVLSGGIEEISAAVGGSSATALFGFGIADGENRGSGALARALESPLLDRGTRLKDAASLWVHVAGGEDMRWAEVQSLMSKASEMTAPDVKMFFGASVEASLVGTVAVTLIAGIPDSFEISADSRPTTARDSDARRADARSNAQSPGPVVRRDDKVQATAAAESNRVFLPEPVRAEHEESNKPAAVQYAFHAPAAVVVQEPVNSSQTIAGSEEKKAESLEVPTRYVETEAAAGERHEATRPAGVTERSGVSEAQRETPLSMHPEGNVRKKETVQEQMSFEPVSRGRFEKTDPTIVDGEDLDIPTFMRQRRE
jgi:cell division protein FtsZ